MGGLAFSAVLFLVALIPVFAYMAEAGEEPGDDDAGSCCPACRLRDLDPDGALEDMSWPSWTPAPRVIA